VFLKCFGTLLAPVVADIFQYSLDKTAIPDDWRLSVIVPVYKSGTLTDPLNYRPIALTSVLCRQLEHIIASYIREYFDGVSFLADEQHGFRKKRSCESQLITTIHKIAELADSGKSVDGIILDFSKAFDTVCHSKLIAKLTATGLNSIMVGWIGEWLKDRRQAVQVGGSCSSWERVESGVPQGSVLGPLLFLAYINDIVNCVHKPNELRLFADDAFLFGVRDPMLQSDLSALHDWSQAWQMNFNAKKCQVLSFGKKLAHHAYHIANEKLEIVTHSRYLGVCIAHDLDWSIQVDRVTNKGARVLGMLRRCLRGANTETKLVLYKTLVRPIIEYASCAWAPYKKKHIVQLEKLQRKSIRWVSAMGRCDSVTQGMLEMSVPSLQQRRARKDTAVLDQIESGKIDISPQHFVPRNTKYNTRRGLVHISSNSATFNNTFFPRAIRQICK